MSDTKKREWSFFVYDVIESCQQIIEITEKISYAQFTRKGVEYHAVIRLLEIVGEAANRIPAEVRALYPEIPWRLMIDTRNRLIHEYFGIDNEIVWDIVKNHIPKLYELFGQIDID